MTDANKQRGRPATGNPMSAAERMRAYRRRKRDAGYKSVRRWEPAGSPAERRFSDHIILDARSLAMHCKIAQKIMENPQLIKEAQSNIERWSKKFDGPRPRYFAEWEEILTLPWREIAERITRMNDDATRLRSSSPFAGVLTDKEREQIYAAFRP